MTYVQAIKICSELNTENEELDDLVIGFGRQSRRRRKNDERTNFSRSYAFDRFLLGNFVRKERNMSIFVKGVEPPKEDEDDGAP